MATFALECPKCGSINSASTFIFAKKVIHCATCGTDINVKQSRMTSKICSHCGKAVVFDQKKKSGIKCPSCGEMIGLSDETAGYKFSEIVCPQCNCNIEIDKTLDTTTCPICDCRIDVKAEIAKKDLVNGTGISVIKYEGDNSTFVWKHPIEDFNWGSQLIVHESQEAIFFMNGQALDTFAKAGRYTLETENLPLLCEAYKLPTGKQDHNAFHAEVYFINKTVQMGIKWGTASRARFVDPLTSIPLDIGASGEMNLSVSNGKKLLLKLVGTTGGLTRDQILGVSERKVNFTNEKNYEYDENGKVKESEVLSGARRREVDQLNSGWSSSLTGFFRPIIAMTVKSYLAGAIKSKNIDILQIDEHLTELSDELRTRISPQFEEYGLYIPQLYVTNISLPEDDPNFKKLVEFRSASFIGTRQAEIEAEIIRSQRQKTIETGLTSIEKAKIEAELKRIQAQGDADAKRMTGYAEADVMQAKGFNQKDVIEASVQKEFARGLGNMAGGGSGGGVASDMMGLGVGLAVAEGMRDRFSGTIGGIVNKKPEEAPEAKNTWKCSCGFAENTGNFCASCGAKKPEAWDCAQCGAKGNLGNFCVQCGAPKPLAWDCPDCGAKGNTGKFCANCGRKYSDSTGWDCSCGAKNITTKFCPNCGKSKED